MQKLIFVLVLVASCDLWKPATVRCESVAASLPEIPKARREKLDELTDLQLDIDLAIARADKRAIESAREMTKAAHEVAREAVREHAKNASRLFQQALEVSEDEDKTTERIARHRCGR